MEATDQDIINVLSETGHLKYPFGVSQEVDTTDLSKLTLDMPEVKRAVSSYQDMHSVPMQPAIAHFWGVGNVMPAVPDGEVGPATRFMFSQPRCQVADYDDEITQAAQGSGNWKGCYSVGDFHCAKVRFKNDPPSFLRPHFDTVWDRVVNMYAEIGLLLVRDDSASRANIECSFVRPDGSWIGLAIVGRGQTCSGSIWAKFDNNYRPANVVNEWTSLVAHEIGHNCGMGHVSGGVMNPYIIKGLSPTWKGDPSYRTLVSKFGGKPVPRDDDPGSRKLVVAYEYEDGRFEKLYDLPTNGGFWPGV